MIKNNKFYIKNLKQVVFLGESQRFKELININNSFGLKTTIVTSSHQSKLLPKKIKFRIFDNLNDDFKKFVKKNFVIENTLFCSLGPRYVFTKDILKFFFLYNLVDFHGTRLPLDAGGGGFSWKIMREDRIDCQMVHLVGEKLDTGPIILNEISIFPSYCKIPQDFEDYRLKKFIKFYSKFIEMLKNNPELELKPQQDYIGRYNPRLRTLLNGYIDWDLNSYDLINFINAFDEPYAGASTFLNSGNFGRLFLKKVHLHGGDSSNHPFMSGIISRHDKDWIVVSTVSKHMLLIEKVLNENSVNILDKLKVGNRFFTPSEKLEKSKSFEIDYSSKGLKKQKKQI